MKKIIAAIIAIVVVFVVALGAESSFSKEKIDFVGEAENIEYYFEKMYLYNTMQDEFDATANLLDINTRVVALDENKKNNLSCLTSRLKFMNWRQMKREIKSKSIMIRRAGYIHSPICSQVK